MSKPGAAPKPSALFISPESPYPAIGGGPLRAASLLEYLVQRYCVDVLVFRQPGESDPKAAFPAGKVREIFVLDLPFHSKSVPARAVRNGLRLLRGRPPLLDRFSGFEDAFERIVTGSPYEIGVVEHFWCAPYIRQLRSGCKKLVIDLVDIESLWHTRVAKASHAGAAMAHNRFAAAYETLERSLLPQYDEILTTSAPDAEFIRPMSGGTKVTIYPNTLPSIPLPAKVEQFSIVFSGNLEYQPNISAVRFFRSKIWPLLRERWPGLIWEIIGKNPHAIAHIVRGDPSIRVTGPVLDAVRAIARSQVAIVPVLAGSGTRVKILEAWAAATPVVSTAIGAEGLDFIAGEHLLIAESAREFAGAVSTLLQSAQDRTRLGQAGRQLYETCYTWEVAWRSLRF